MVSSIRTIVFLSFAATSTLAAQAPGAPPQGMNGPARGAGAPAAKMLLAHTGELDLTDAQVVKLAAISRRVEARRRSLRASMDSARSRFGTQRPSAADSAARRQFRDRMRADLDRVREQSKTDQRDAIAVLTADQQARAWELVANRGGGRARGMQRGGGMQRGMRQGGRRPRAMARPGVGPRGFRDDMPRPRQRPPIE
jgi:Spy/CpxP family protein refolding chaperone